LGAYTRSYSVPLERAGEIAATACPNEIRIRAFACRSVPRGLCTSITVKACARPLTRSKLFAHLGLEQDRLARHSTLGVETGAGARSHGQLGKRFMCRLANSEWGVAQLRNRQQCGAAATVCYVARGAEKSRRPNRDFSRPSSPREMTAGVREPHRPDGLFARGRRVHRCSVRIRPSATLAHVLR
jgi:hypothetical protein